jgi:oligopeptide transport system substrate-binding protein
MKFRLLALVLLTTGLAPRAWPAGAPQVIRYNIAAEPETLDPTLSTGIPEATVILNCFEGLTRVARDGKTIEPRAAERWEISPDGKTYTFHLRPTRWSDGTPVTAHDFVYAYRRILDPAVGAEYATMLYYLENGEALNTGKIKDPTKIGVRAIDDRTLEVRLVAPTPFFLRVVEHHAYVPLPRHVIEKNPNWSIAPASYVCNGPFVLTYWSHHDRLVLKPNPHYWNRSKIALDELVFRTVDSVSTELAMYETNELDMTYQMPTESIRRLRSSPEFRSEPQVATYYVCFNNKKKPTDDPRVRRALSLAIDRRIITRVITQGGEPVAQAYVAPGIPDAEGTGRDFRDVGGDLFQSPNVEEARRLLAEAGYPGGRGFPVLAYSYNDDERHRKIAMVLQNVWKRTLGIQVTLQVEEWKVFLSNRRTGNYQICRHGWTGDYADPMTFLDGFLTGLGLNDADYSNPEYDQLVVAARLEADSVKRMALLHRAEKILIDDMAIAPLFYYRNIYMQKPWVKGVNRTPFGYAYFDEARAER